MKEPVQTKTYRVSFVATSHIRIDLEAPSQAAAIEEAERLYVEAASNDPRFVVFGGDAFCEAEAEEA